MSSPLWGVLLSFIRMYVSGCISWPNLAGLMQHGVRSRCVPPNDVIMDITHHWYWYILQNFLDRGRISSQEFGNFCQFKNCIAQAYIHNYLVITFRYQLLISTIFLSLTGTYIHSQSWLLTVINSIIFFMIDPFFAFSTGLLSTKSHLNCINRRKHRKGFAPTSNQAPCVICVRTRECI